MIPLITYISFTTDFWSSGSDQFLSLTGHCMFENFDVQAVVLHAQPFTDRHTSVNINETIDNMVNEFNIPEYKVNSIVHDSASNMVRGIEDSPYNSLPCFTHTSQTALNECIFEQESVKKIVKKCKSIYAHFNNSYLEMSRLHKVQKELGHKELVPLNDCPTRWDSSFLMLERALELKTGLVLYSSRYDCVEITPSEWTTMDKLADLLQLFHSMTKSMSYRYANAGEIIPFVKILKDYVTDEVTKLKLTGLHTTLLSLNDSFNRRFSKYLNNQNCILATYLDPRHKSVFDDEIEGSIRYLEDVELALISNYLEHKKKQDERDNTVIAENTTGTTNTEPHTDTQEPMNSTENDFDGFKSKKIDIIAWRHAKLFSKKAKSTQPEPSVDTVSLRRLQIQAEISSYKKISPIELESNPFDWWKKHMAIFPCLSEMAQKYLSCPPSSVESERLFSIGGNIITTKRRRLGADNSEKLMFLNYNLRLFPELKYF